MGLNLCVPAFLRQKVRRTLARQPGLCYDTKEPGRQARDLLLERNSKLYDEFKTIGRPLPVRGAGTVRPERLQERE